MHVKDFFPEAYQVDLRTPKGDKRKMGHFSSALSVKNNVTFVNLYAQYHYGKGDR